MLSLKKRYFKWKCNLWEQAGRDISWEQRRQKYICPGHPWLYLTSDPKLQWHQTQNWKHIPNGISLHRLVKTKKNKTKKTPPQPLEIIELPYPAYFLHLHRGLTLFRVLFSQACEWGCISTVNLYPAPKVKGLSVLCGFRVDDILYSFPSFSFFF